AVMQRRPLKVKSGRERAHLVIAGCLNIACFTLFTAFAQLARIAGLSGPRRAVQSLAWHFAPAGRPWIGRADLSADRIERLDRPCSRSGDGDELGSRYSLLEMGADRRRSDGNLGVAALCGAPGHRRRIVRRRRVAPPLARSPSRTLGVGLFCSLRVSLRLSALVRDRAQVATSDRVPRRAERSGRWHRGLSADPGRATDYHRYGRLRAHLGGRRHSIARTQCTPIGDGSDRTMTSPTIGSADLRDTCPELARGDKSKKALRIDIHLEPDSAFALGRGGNPSAQIS